MPAMKMASMKKVASGNKPMTKGAFAQALADACGTKRKVAAEFLQHQAEICGASLGKTGKVTIPGLCMIKTRQKAATKACVKNIFGKECRISAMKARTVVKAFPIKALKDEYK